jgi:hypothetical protein
MTAMNAWRSDRAAYLMNDTAMFDPATGEVNGFTDKTITLTALNWHAAIGVTGYLYPGDLKAKLSQLELRSLPELVAVLPPILSKIEADLPWRERRPLGLVIASWSDDEGSAVRCLSNLPGGSDGVFPAGYPEGRVCIIDYWLTGNGSHPALSATGKIENADEGDAIAAEIIAEQRAAPFESIGCHGIGGAAYITRVGKIGCHTWKVADWPQDRVGERIAAQPAPQRCRGSALSATAADSMPAASMA